MIFKKDTSILSNQGKAAKPIFRPLNAIGQPPPQKNTNPEACNVNDLASLGKPPLYRLQAYPALGV